MQELVTQATEYNSMIMNDHLLTHVDLMYDIHQSTFSNSKHVHERLYSLVRHFQKLCNEYMNSIIGYEIWVNNVGNFWTDWGKRKGKTDGLT